MWFPEFKEDATDGKQYLEGVVYEDDDKKIILEIHGLFGNTQKGIVVELPQEMRNVISEESESCDTHYVGHEHRFFGNTCNIYRQNSYNDRDTSILRMSGTGLRYDEEFLGKPVTIHNKYLAYWVRANLYISYEYNNNADSENEIDEFIDNVSYNKMYYQQDMIGLKKCAGAMMYLMNFEDYELQDYFRTLLSMTPIYLAMLPEKKVLV